jgi:hypothetical protein
MDGVTVLYTDSPQASEVQLRVVDWPAWGLEGARGTIECLGAGGKARFGVVLQGKASLTAALEGSREIGALVLTAVRILTLIHIIATLSVCIEDVARLAFTGVREC